MSPRLALGMVLLAAVLVPSGALADGLPIPVDDVGPTGVVSPDGRSRYVTVYAGGRTVVDRVKSHGGAIGASSFLRGKFTIPVVALDGTPGGLSHDGGTLVLIRPRAGFPRRTTPLAVIDAHTLRTRTTVTLRGDFSFDALSPDGRTVFLVQYVNPRDPNDYLVRALDPRTGRLESKPIVDPSERGDEMRGLPLHRIVSADGRWHYTLYDGAGGAPFIHALDTRARRAKCIDLPPGGDPTAFGLTLGRGRLTVVRPGGPLAFVDTRTFRVTRPGARRASVAAESSGLGWAVAGGVLLLAMAAWRSMRPGPPGRRLRGASPRRGRART